MSKRIFSSEEQQWLRENQNVKRCSDRSITYTTAFKEQAVQQYEGGLTSTEIFKRAGFDIDLIGRKQPKGCLRRWRATYKEKGIAGLTEARGKNSIGTKKKQANTETDRLKWLEAEVKYLKAENAFLARLRAKRAE